MMKYLIIFLLFFGLHVHAFNKGEPLVGDIAEKETAKPSTFIVNKKGEIVYSKVSNTHGGRSKVEEIIQALEAL